MKPYLKLHILWVIVGLLCGSLRILADNSQLVTTTEGNDYYVTWLLNGSSQISPTPDPDLKLTLIASARQMTQIVVEYGNNATQTFTIPAGGSTIIEIDPSSAYIDLVTNETETKTKKGVRVYSTDKKKRFTLIAGNKNGQSGSTTSYDVTMVVPKEGLGKEYVVQAHNIDRLSNEFVIMGTEEETTVTVNLSNGTINHPTGGSVTITLDSKDIWLATAANASLDLSGTTICSDKPIAVFNGNRSAQIPKKETYSDDHIFEQALSIERWGTEFVVPMLSGHLKEVYVEITAAFNNTHIDIAGGTAGLIDAAVNLNQGETYRGRLRSGALYIKADVPIMVYLYSTCGAYNSYEDEHFDTHLPGDPSSTIVNAIEQFVDSTIYTTYTNPDADPDAPLTHYVNLVTADPTNMLFDGVNIASSFSLAAGGLYYYTTREVSEGTHTIANPKGFTGYAYGLNDGQIYLNSVGYKFVPFADSLFVVSDYMSNYSYFLPKMDQGYYQRQRKEWPIGQERLDTVYICTKTEVEFLGQLAMSYLPRNEVQWEVWLLHNGKKYESVKKVEILPDIADQQSWKYMFEVEDQEGLSPELRTPYTDYQVDFQIFRDHTICTDLERSADTLSTIVHVLRAFNDTATKVICMGDTLRFFKDLGVEIDPVSHLYERGTGEDSTSYVSVASKPFDVAYTKGEWQYFTHAYNSSFDCDSLMTLKLYVCDTFRTRLDTTICENQTLSYDDKFIGQIFSNEPNTDYVYLDTLKTTSCGCLEDVPDFKGCDSIIELHVHVCPIYRDTLRDTICTNGDYTIPYEWYRPKDHSFVKNITLQQSDLGTTKFFSDTLKSKGCPNCDTGCDSIFVLQLYVPPFTHETQTTRFCDAEYDWGTHTIHYKENIYDLWPNHNGHIVWDVNNNKRISVADIVNMTGGSTNTFIDSLTTINGCDSIFALTITKDTLFHHVEQRNVPNNMPFTWHGITYGPFPDEPEGSVKVFYDPNATKTKAGCDSIWKLELTISESFYQEVHESICDNADFIWTGHKCGKTYDTAFIHPAAGIYEVYDNLKTVVRPDKPIACDSIWKLILTVSKTYEEFDTIHLCDNEIVDWNGFKYAGPKAASGSYREQFVDPDGTSPYYEKNDEEMFTTVNMCDSMCHVHFYIHRTYDLRDADVVICADSAFVWKGHSDKGHKIYDATTGNIINFGKGKLWTNSTNKTFELIDYMKTETCSECPEHGCDSIHRLKLTVNPVYGPIVVDTIYCLLEGLPFRWQPDAKNPSYVREFWRDTTACYDTLQTAGCGCDSIYELRFHIYDNLPKTYDTIVCQSATPFILGTTAVTFTPNDSTEGMHTIVKTIYDPQAMGCPYVETWNVMVRPYYPSADHPGFTYQDTICQGLAGETWEWTSPDGTRQLWDKQNNKNISGTNIPVNKTGTFIYIDSLRTHKMEYCDCDSIETLQLVVVPSYTADINKRIISSTICDNDTVSWEGRLFVGDKFAAFHKTYNASLYPRGVQVVAAGQHADIDTVYDKTYLSKQTSRFDCDSLTFFNLTVKATAESLIHMDNCDANDHRDKDVWYANMNNGVGGYLPHPHVTTITSSEYWDTIPAKNGCDSVVHLIYTVFPTYYKESKDTICGDSTYIWNPEDVANGHVYRNGKRVTKISTTLDEGLIADTLVYMDSLQTINGCDSIEVLKLFVTRSYAFHHTTKVSSEDSIHWQGKTYVGEFFEGEYRKDTVTMVYADLCDTVIYSTHRSDGIACDSIYFLRLALGKVFRDTTYDYVCDNCTYDWHLTSPITGQDVLAAKDRMVEANKKDTIYHKCKTEMGFDSIYVLILSGFPTYKFEVSDTVCQGTDATWTDHATSTHLYQDGKHITEINTTQYGWTTIVDSLETQTFFTDPKGVRTRMSACDSIWIRHLYVSPTYDEEYNRLSVTDKLEVCSNETIVWDSTLYVGYNYDSISYPIQTPPMIGLAYNQVVHTKDVPLSHDTLYDRHFYQTKLECDSVQFLQLAIHRSPFVQLYDTIGDNDEVWEFGHGNNYHQASEFHVDDYADLSRVPYSKFFIDTLSSYNGCDSIVWDSLLVVPSYTFVLDTAVCANMRFDWRRWKELNHTYSQVLRDTVRSIYGSDEIYVLKMELIPAFEEEGRLNMCKNDTMMWQHTEIYYHPENGDADIEYWARYPRQDNKCDSVFHMHVNYFDYYHFTTSERMTTDTICQFEDWHWYETDGTEHTKALRSEDGRKWDRIPTDTTGWIIIYDSLTTSAPCHCDSTFMLRLYVKPGFRDYSATEYIVCSTDSVYWDQTDRFYKSEWAGDVYDTISYPNRWGCDSTYYFHMHIRQSYDSLLVDTVCADEGEYIWQDQSYSAMLKEVWTAENESTIYDIRNYTAIEGCDSIFRLQLTITPISIEEWEDTICHGDVLMFNDKQLTEAGTYHDTLVNKWGCRDYQTLHLAVIPPTTFSVGDPQLCADNAQFEVPFSYEGRMPIAYTVVYDSLAKARNFTDDYDVYIPAGDTILYLTMPAHDRPTDYTRPDHYTATIYFDNGICRDSMLLRVPFSFEPKYPSWIIEQHWNDQIAILVPNLNGGYEFDSYQWYCNDTMMIGETKSYLYQPHWLDSTYRYSVALTRAGDSIAYRTCDLTPVLREKDPLSPTMPYISVVPTVVVKENPVVNILSINPGTYSIYNSLGAIIESGDINPDIHHAMEVRLPSTSGIYIFHLSETSGLERAVKVMVE